MNKMRTLSGATPRTTGASRPGLNLAYSVGEREGGGKMKMLLFNILQDMAAELAEIFEILKRVMNFSRVDFCIFVCQKVSKASHRFDFSGKVFGYNAFCTKGKDRLFVGAGAFPVVLRNYVMGDVKEGLYVHF